MSPLTDKERESYLNQINCFIRKEKLEDTDNKNYRKFRDHCYYRDKY